MQNSKKHSASNYLVKAERMPTKTNLLDIPMAQTIDLFLTNFEWLIEMVDTVLQELDGLHLP